MAGFCASTDSFCRNGLLTCVPGFYPKLCCKQMNHPRGFSRGSFVPFATFRACWVLLGTRLWDHSGFIPTSVIQVGMPSLHGGVAFGGPFSCITVGISTTALWEIHVAKVNFGLFGPLSGSEVPSKLLPQSSCSDFGGSSDSRRKAPVFFLGTCYFFPGSE